jgi:predicted Zn-dependent protease
MPGLLHRLRQRGARWLLIGLLLGGVAQAAEGPDLALPEMGQPANQAMTPAEERRLGRQIMSEVRRKLPVMDDPLINHYVRDIGGRIASFAGAGRAFEFFTINRDQINAFAMPGGYIGIYTGLLTETQSESEFASVVAHEIAHVTQRHIARQRLRAESVNLRTTAMMLAGLVIATQNPEAGQAAIMGGAAAGVQSRLNFSREFEREADRIGLQALAAAGFRPEAMAEFFERLQRANRYRGEPLPFLSTHPLTKARISRARERADSLPRRNTFESPAYPFVRARAMVLAAANPDQAIARFDKQIESQGQSAARTYGRAVALIEAGRGDEAIEPLKQLIDSEGEYSIFYTTLAEAHLAEDQAGQALTVLDNGLSLYPGDYALRYTRIEALLADGKGREALRTADDAKRDFPSDVQLLDLRARAAQAGGDRAQQAITTAEYYAALGNLRGALRQLDRILGSASVSTYQRSRAEALRERWQQRLQRQQG